jgi:hypothetical protein
MNKTLGENLVVEYTDEGVDNPLVVLFYKTLGGIEYIDIDKCINNVIKLYETNKDITLGLEFLY